MARFDSLRFVYESAEAVRAAGAIQQTLIQNIHLTLPVISLLTPGGFPITFEESFNITNFKQQCVDCPDANAGSRGLMESVCRASKEEGVPTGSCDYIQTYFKANRCAALQYEANTTFDTMTAFSDKIESLVLPLADYYVCSSKGIRHIFETRIVWGDQSFVTGSPDFCPFAITTREIQSWQVFRNGLQTAFGGIHLASCAGSTTRVQVDLMNGALLSTIVTDLRPIQDVFHCPECKPILDFLPPIT